MIKLKLLPLTRSTSVNYSERQLDKDLTVQEMMPKTKSEGLHFLTRMGELIEGFPKVPPFLSKTVEEGEISDVLRGIPLTYSSLGDLVLDPDSVTFLLQEDGEVTLLDVVGYWKLFDSIFGDRDIRPTVGERIFLSESIQTHFVCNETFQALMMSIVESFFTPLRPLIIRSDHSSEEESGQGKYRSIPVLTLNPETLARATYGVITSALAPQNIDTKGDMGIILQEFRTFKTSFVIHMYPESVIISCVSGGCERAVAGEEDSAYCFPLKDLSLTPHALTRDGEPILDVPSFVYDLLPSLQSILHVSGLSDIEGGLDDEGLWFTQCRAMPISVVSPLEAPELVCLPAEPLSGTGYVTFGLAYGEVLDLSESSLAESAATQPIKDKVVIVASGTRPEDIAKLKGIAALLVLSPVGNGHIVVQAMGHYPVVYCPDKTLVPTHVTVAAYKERSSSQTRSVILAGNQLDVLSTQLEKMKYSGPLFSTHVRFRKNSFDTLTLQFNFMSSNDHCVSALGRPSLLKMPPFALAEQVKQMSNDEWRQFAGWIAKDVATLINLVLDMCFLLTELDGLLHAADDYNKYVNELSQFFSRCESIRSTTCSVLNCLESKNLRHLARAKLFQQIHTFVYSLETDPEGPDASIHSIVRYLHDLQVELTDSAPAQFPAEAWGDTLNKLKQKADPFIALNLINSVKLHLNHSVLMIHFKLGLHYSRVLIHLNGDITLQCYANDFGNTQAKGFTRMLYFRAWMESQYGSFVTCEKQETTLTYTYKVDPDQVVALCPRFMEALCTLMQKDLDLGIRYSSDVDAKSPELSPNLVLETALILTLTSTVNWQTLFETTPRDAFKVVVFFVGQLLKYWIPEVPIDLKTANSLLAQAELSREDSLLATINSMRACNCLPKITCPQDSLLPLLRDTDFQSLFFTINTLISSPRVDSVPYLDLKRVGDSVCTDVGLITSYLSSRLMYGRLSLLYSSELTPEIFHRLIASVAQKMVEKHGCEGMLLKDIYKLYQRQLAQLMNGCLVVNECDSHQFETCFDDMVSNVFSKQLL